MRTFETGPCSLPTYPVYVRAALLFILTASGLLAQNNLSVSPFTVFLSGLEGGSPVSQTFAVSSSPFSVPFTASVSNAPWLSLAPSSGNTPATLSVTANPAGMGPGVYSASVNIASPNAGTITQLVVLTVNSPPSFRSIPDSLVFTYQPGAALPPTQALSISSVNGSAIPSYTPLALSANWLTISGGGPVVSVGINPNGIQPGQTYVDGVQIVPASGSGALIVPVVLYYATAPAISASPSSLNFNFQSNGTNNVLQQTITVNPPGTNFTATATVSVGTPQWLSVNRTAGTGNITVTVSPAVLGTGTYQGSVIISSGATSITVPVTLSVNTQPLLTLSTNNLNFSFQPGGPNPPDQTVTPTTTTPGAPYTVTASSQGNWLSVNSSNQVTPNAVNVSVTPSGLAAGTYTGTITFNATGVSNNPQTVTVTLTISSNPALTATPNPINFNYEIGQAVPGVQSVSVTSLGSPLSYTVSANGNANGLTWLLTGQPGAATPSSFTVAVSPAGLGPGTYNGTLQLSSPGANAQLTIPVTLHISNVALLNLPSSLSFNSLVGAAPGQAGQTQTVSVTSTGEAVSYLVAAQTITPSGGNWLQVGSPSGSASSTFPSSFVVTVNPTGLSAGVYKGNLLVHLNNGNPDVNVPVTYTLTAGNLTFSSSTLSFSQASGGAAPASQTINVGSSGGPISFSAFSAVNVGTNWLTVTPTSATTPATLTMSVNGGGLPPGNYSGTITIASPTAGNSPQTITVNLTVTQQQQTFTVAPGSLAFSTQAGSPASQNIAVSTSFGTLPFTATAIVTSGGINWLSVSPASGMASQSPVNLTVAVNPQGLAVGTYNGSIVISASGTPISQAIPVTFVVASNPTPAPTAIQNAGSATVGAIAPGEIISIFGSNLGPAVPVTATVSPAGFFPTSLGETQVLFDNIPGVMWYSSSTQLNVIVPYEIAGRISTVVQIVFRGVPSASLNLSVAPTAPGIFANQFGQAAALNANGTINAPFNPAQKGTPIVLYATGEGVTTPPGVSGQVNFVNLKKPLAQVSVTIGGQPAEVQYAGSAPGFVSGAFQVNALIPDTAPSGSAVQVVLTVGGASSSGVATVAIQ